ncbi:hypothetical protein PISMIDRAFT_678732 [Pisolithus microcarpus 441]|uniref:Uncharacterized protein n=1 Tax=Pisolithus microcarpus 441 TaxID=765257 RepID=A0A0C9Z4J7_9AGAM|nr:hypothetical protein PISMIDRAFT_678732 [Pisolithus microcarpus 441]
MRWGQSDGYIDAKLILNHRYNHSGTSHVSVHIDLLPSAPGDLQSATRLHKGFAEKGS